MTERLQIYSQMFQSQINDSARVSVQSALQLQNASTLQANILAYNDTYLLDGRHCHRHAGLDFMALAAPAHHRVCLALKKATAVR